MNDWIRYVDQASGKPFWYSEARGYSTWNSQETVVEPAADAMPAGAAARPQQVNNGNPYQRNADVLASFERELAEERAKLPAFRAQNAAIQAASTNPYYQSLAAPATTQGHVQQQPLHDSGYHQRRQQFAAFRQRLAADRERDARNRVATAATTYPHAQGFFAPATTQGYVQQQPSLFNPTLLRMQQELDEQMRSDPVLRWLRQP